MKEEGWKMKIKVCAEKKERIDKYLAMHTDYHRSFIQKLILHEFVF